MNLKPDVSFYILGAFVLVMLGFQIHSTKTELAKTKSTLAVVEASNKVLRAAEDLTSEATKRQLEREQALREQSDERISALQKALQNNVCANTRLPDPILNQLRPP